MFMVWFTHTHTHTYMVKDLGSGRVARQQPTTRLFSPFLVMSLNLVPRTEIEEEP
jgi:hypothetical protein